MQQSERIYSSGYRFGYQGSEKDPETHNNADVYNTEYRMLDVRLGRWFSTDPLEELNTEASPYVTMNNSPISLNDPDGLWPGNDLFKRHYRHGKAKKSKTSIGFKFMKLTGWFRQAFSGAKHLTMQRPRYGYRTSGWQNVGSGTLNSGDNQDFNLYNSGLLNNKIAGDHITNVQMRTYDPNDQTQHHNSFMRVQGLRSSLFDSHPKYRGIATNTGLSPWSGDDPSGYAFANFIPGVDIIYQAFEKFEVGLALLMPDVMDFFVKNQWKLLAGVFGNHNLNPLYRNSSALRVENCWSNKPMGFTLRIKTRNLVVKRRGWLWTKLHTI